MPKTFNSNSFSSTYRDDWNEDDNYHKILFNSGRSLQARELTQLQTIIQKEIERFGTNIFKEGAAVDAGDPFINSNYRYVKLSGFNGPAGNTIENVPSGLEITGSVSGVVARVIETVKASGPDPDTLYVQYISSGTQTASTETVQFSPGEALTATNWNFAVAGAGTDPVGAGVKFRVSEGDFFVLGHFVHAKEQSIFLSKYSQSVDAVVGYKVIQDIITVDDTTALYDNAGPTPNTSAPGADRYRITLDLVNQDDISIDETFVYFSKIENSKIVDVASPTDGFNKINDLLAIRTYEESGNYMVRPFTINMQEIDGDANNLELIISAGTAYVNGYRVENPSPIKLIVPKPQGTETVTNKSVAFSFGNYFVANGANNKGLPELDFDNPGFTFGDTYDLLNGSNGTGISQGTCKIRSIDKVGSNLRIYIFDLKVTGDLNALQSLGLTGSNTTQYFNIVEPLQDVNNNDLLFQLPRPRPSSVTNSSFTVQRYLSASSTQTISLPALGSNEAYTDTSLWIVSSSTGAVTTPTSINLGSNEIVMPTTDAWHVLYYVNKGNASAAGKTLQFHEVSNPIQTAPDGTKYVDLEKHDIYDVEKITLVTTNGENVSNMFTLDNGQRDNYYDIGRLILDNDKTISDNIFCRFRYFSRGQAGDYYDITSYGVNYDEIPSHKIKDGTIVNLRDFIDLRPDRLANGSFSNIKELPRNGSNMNADIGFYLPRADKLIVSQDGDFSVLKGEQSEVPQFKKTPENSLELFKIVMNANTLNARDLSVTPIEYKRYTMSDINKLEKKIDKLEETTTLSLVELESKLTAALNSAGDARPETGFVVDNFSDQISSDTEVDDYRASIDPESRLLKPAFDEDNIRLIIDSAASSNVLLKGDNVYLNYVSSEWVGQNIASTSVAVNVFKNSENIGTIVLSPSSDEWKGTGEKANHVVDGSVRLDRNEAFLWNNWEWNWGGRNIDDLEIPEERGTLSTGVVRNRRFGAFGRRGLYESRKFSSDKSRRPTNTTSRGHVSRVVSSDTIRSNIGNRIVDAAITPWMRSRKIYFHAKGLKPLTKFIPFFDGIRVDDWCRVETNFVRYSNRTDDQGNLYTNVAVLGHPDGSSALTSDANGEIKGSFFIPNIRPTKSVRQYGLPQKEVNAGLRFRSGVREFKLLDITDNDYANAGSKAVAFYTSAGTLENKKSNMLTSRPSAFLSPVFEGLSFPLVYSSPEIKKYLDAITSGEINLGTSNDPTDGAKIPGLNSPGQAAVDPALYNGSMSTILSDYVSINNNQSNSSSILPAASRENPLAQSFKVNNQFGVTLTKISLYFSQVDTSLPIELQIRPIVDGSPSRTEIVPGSSVFLNYNEVTTPANENNIQSILAAPTDFVFDEPLYLNPWTEYAIVLITSSSNYKVYTALNDQFVIGSTNKRVSTSSSYGNLYRNSYGVVWGPSKNSSLMYKLHRAVFDTNGTLILRNANVPGKLLKNNPFQTTDLSTYVYVNHPCHGFDSGETVSLVVDTSQTFANIPGSELNGSHLIYGKDIHGYRIKVTTGANATANVGGDDVIASRNIQYNVINPYIESIVPNSTSIDVSAKLTTGRSLSGSETKYSKDGSYLRMTPRTNTSFSSPRIIANRTIENLSVASIPNASALNGKYSANLRIDFKSGNSYVSPIVDLQRASLVLVGYCVDDGDSSSQINYVPETDPYSGSSGSKHVTTPFTLGQESVGMQIKINANVPSSSDFDLYYRTATEGNNIYDQQWVLNDQLYPTPKDDDPDVFRQIEFLPGGTEGTLTEFNTAQVKLVMKSKSMGEVPSFRDLSIKFLGL